MSRNSEMGWPVGSCGVASQRRLAAGEFGLTKPTQDVAEHEGLMVFQSAVVVVEIVDHDTEGFGCGIRLLNGRSKLQVVAVLWAARPVVELGALVAAHGDRGGGVMGVHDRL